MYTWLPDIPISYYKLFCEVPIALHPWSFESGDHALMCTWLETSTSLETSRINFQSVSSHAHETLQTSYNHWIQIFPATVILVQAFAITKNQESNHHSSGSISNSSYAALGFCCFGPRCRHFTFKNCWDGFSSLRGVSYFSFNVQNRCHFDCDRPQQVWCYWCHNSVWLLSAAWRVTASCSRGLGTDAKRNDLPDIINNHQHVCIAT